MIHNIAEERKKRNRQESPLSNSIGDEELLRLISQVEESALIHAPGGLKEEIFFQLGAERQRRQKRRLFSYRAKVLVGMAAALAVLILVPADRTGETDASQMSMFGRLYGEEEESEVWEQELLDRQRDIDRTWERYRKGQERVGVTKHYVEIITDKLTDYEDWED